MGSCFVDRIGELIELTAAEMVALSGLEQRERSLRRGAVLLREHDKLADMFIVRRGVLMSFVLLPDGSRQILRFLFPGDLIGVSSLVYRTSTESIAALSEAVVAPFDRALIGTLIAEHPRLTGVLMALHEMERVILTDRLAALGRTSAKVRVASLLIEIRNRQRIDDRNIGASFALGLTQEEIGDATGLTSVHVNRMLRQLEEEGMISRAGGRFTITNEPALIRAANYIDRSSRIDLGWLPAAK
ncbi:Crp/Fnr family transcriptional regulator [Sphingomonas sp. GC_Shp_1]|uniref:Crp/Fnr family transcriptional regulator n=1 Tax=unclassified Sphingomonas TaxID=196159 RepID=UPI00226A172A